MLTWGAFQIIGGSPDSREKLTRDQQKLIGLVQSEIDNFGIEDDGNGWKAKVFLYCLEVRCPQSGWTVPLLPSFVISKPRTGEKNNVVAELLPDLKRKRYNIVIRSGVTETELMAATQGTIRNDGRGQDPYMIHVVNGTEYRTKISTLRRDYRKADGTNGNGLRMWEKHEFRPRTDDIFQERLYAIQWMKRKKERKKIICLRIPSGYRGGSETRAYCRKICWEAPC